MNVPFSPTERLGRRFLLGGLMLSGALIAMGLVLAAASGDLAERVVPLRALGPALMAAEPAAFISLGVLVLIATPLLRVVAAMVGFGREGDLRFAGLTALVLAIVLSGLVIGP
jgi:uncharacterized membrane protein